MGEQGASTVDELVGRTHELHEIEAATAAAAAGRGTVVLVSGEAGIGKSRLCAEAEVRAARAGLTTVTTRCWPDGGAPALWPWQPILRSLGGDAAAELLEADGGAAAVDPHRFARFAAVTDQLAAATAAAPVCVVIDDVHAADAGTLLLLRFVTRALPRLRLALVLSRRPDRPEPDRLEARLLDDIEAEAVPLVLRRFDVAESAALLALHGFTDVEHDLLMTVQQVTGGNPLHLRRVAALGAPDAERALPDGIHATIERSLRNLAPATRLLLRTTAVLGPSPSVAEAAAVAGVDPATVLDVVRVATAAGLVTPDATDRFTFGHELVRSALEAGLTSADRLAAHARAVPVVAGEGPTIAPDRLARRAHHALTAAARSVDDARVAVAACEDAARSMVASFAYEQADALLTAAVELHDRPGPGTAPGRLLLAWAQAAWQCGRLAEARTRFDRAATAAQHEEDPVVFAEAALGLGGHWLHEHRAPVERARVLGLQRSARERLPAAEVGLRARLAARLAAEAMYDRDPPDDATGLAAVRAALDDARRSSDPVALAEALSLGHHAMLAPEHAHGRRGMADELIRVASEAGHGVLALLGLCWRAVDLFLLGDEQAGRALEDLRERADALACQNILYIVDVIDVMLMIRAGRLDQAEAAAQRCYATGTAVGEVDALGYVGAHTLAIHWIKGTDADLVDAAREVAASPTLVPAEFAFRATAAALAARAGRYEEARATVDLLAADGLGALPRSSTWLVGMAAIAEVAVELDDPALAGEAYDLLSPFADRPVMPSLAVVCLGSVARALGAAALAFGDVDAAVAHLEQAIDDDRRRGHRPLVAIAQAELALALRRRGRAADRDRADALLDRAVAEGAAMSMTGRVAAWTAAAGAVRPVEVGGATEPAAAAAAGEAAETETAETAETVTEVVVAEGHGVFRRAGRGWLVGVGDHQAFVADRVGMGYLVRLLRHPGQGIPALALAGAGPEAGSDERSPQQVIDQAARSAYAERIRELSEDLAEAEAHADIGRAGRLRLELDALVDHIEAATGLHGRPRRFAGRSERARTAVRKAVKRAIDEIDTAEPVVGHALRTTITTGSVCTYTPDPRSPVAWSFDDLPADL